MFDHRNEILLILLRILEKISRKILILKYYISTSPTNSYKSFDGSVNGEKLIG